MVMTPVIVSNLVVASDQEMASDRVGFYHLS